MEGELNELKERVQEMQGVVSQLLRRWDAIVLIEFILDIG